MNNKTPFDICDYVFLSNTVWNTCHNIIIAKLFLLSQWIPDVQTKPYIFLMIPSVC